MTMISKPKGQVNDSQISLAANENPLGPSPKALAAIKAALALLNLYPAQDDLSLRRKLAEFHGRDLTVDHFFAANGGVEVLSMIEDAVLGSDQSAILCPPCFGPYRASLTAKGLGFQTVALTRPEFLPDVDAILTAVTDQTRLIYLTNPNNPTGTYFGADLLLRLLDGLPSHVTVIYDEVYYQFATGFDLPDVIKLVHEDRNLFVVHSFSKAYGLAGARVGYAIAPPRLIQTVVPRKRSFHINRLSLAGATAALDDTEFLATAVANNTAQRAILLTGLRDMGLTAWASEANFVMFESPGGRPAKDLCAALAQSGVLVRPAFDLPGHVRASVGQPNETQAFLAALKRAI